jgi:hypothetical protein
VSEDTYAIHDHQTALMRSSEDGLGVRPVVPVPGEQYGLLRVDRLAEIIAGNRIWILTCLGCGCEQRRTSASLNRRVRSGQEPQCPRCLRELRRSLSAARRDSLSKMLSNYWDEYGTLYPPQSVADLCDEVMADLEAEICPRRDSVAEIDLLRLETHVDYPWSGPGSGNGNAVADSEANEDARVAASVISEEKKFVQQLRQASQGHL